MNFREPVIAGLATTLCLGCFADGASSVTGAVHSASGAPLSQVNVRLEAPGKSAAPDGNTVDTSSTNQSGCFHVFGTHAPGRVKIALIAEKNGYKTCRADASAGRYKAR